MATEADFNRIGNYARMYNKDQRIDRRKASRTVPMEVLCLGYSRTGTLSMRKAMEILGYPNPYHFSSILDNPRDSDMWVQALDAKYNGRGTITSWRRFFDGLLGHVGAVTDMPCIAFAEELVDSYPDAKVVLVEREIESWYRSWMAHCQSPYDLVIYLFGLLDPYWSGRINGIGVAVTVLSSGHAMTLGQARVRSKAAYQHHYQDVRDLVPKEKLLNFKIEEGWKPLCEFLGKPVPNVTFPHENDSAANKQFFVELVQKELKNIAWNAAMLMIGVGGAVVAVVWYLRRK